MAMKKKMAKLGDDYHLTLLGSGIKICSPCKFMLLTLILFLSRAFLANELRHSFYSNQAERKAVY